MICINCFNPKTKVVNSRPHKKSSSTWRRRKCPKCQALFSTTELPSLEENQNILSSSGQSRPFNAGKLVISISKAFAHDPERAQYDSIWLARTVEEILSTEYTSLTNDDIAAVTHQTLKRFDELAAVQYAARHQLIVSTKRRGRPSLREPGQRSQG